MALRLIGTVIGSGLNDQTGIGQITIQCNSVSVQGGLLYLNAALPIDTSSLSIGQSVWICIALNSGEQTAIAGAVTLNPMSTVD